MIVAIQVLENDGEFAVTADTVYSESKNREFTVFQLQLGDNILYRGFDVRELKKIKREHNVTKHRQQLRRKRMQHAGT